MPQPHTENWGSKHCGVQQGREEMERGDSPELVTCAQEPLDMPPPWASQGLQEGAAVNRAQHFCVSWAWGEARGSGLDREGCMEGHCLHISHPDPVSSALPPWSPEEPLGLSNTNTGT